MRILYFDRREKIGVRRRRGNGTERRVEFIISTANGGGGFFEKPVCDNNWISSCSPSGLIIAGRFFHVVRRACILRRLSRGLDFPRGEVEDSEEGGKAKGKEGVGRGGEGEDARGCKTKEAWPRH